MSCLGVSSYSYLIYGMILYSAIPSESAGKLNKLAEWYKGASRTSDNNSADDACNNLANDKCQTIIQSRNGISGNNNFVRCCFTSFTLLIHQFNQSDDGYYWYQISANNFHLQPSPSGYISRMNVKMLGTNNRSCLPGEFIHHLNPPVCAENSMRAISHRVTCTSQTVTTISQSVEIVTTDVNSWVYGTIAGAVVSILLTTS